MSELGEGPQDIKEPPKFSGEPLPFTEERKNQISRAIAEFDGVTESAKLLGRKETEFIDRVRPEAQALRRIATNGNPREVGYRQVNEMAEVLLGHSFGRRLDRIAELAITYVNGQPQARERILEVLKTAAQEPNLGEAGKLVGEAVQEFGRAITRLEDARTHQKGDRNELGRSVGENAEQSQRLYHRTSAEVTRGIEGGVLQAYYTRSRQVNEGVQSDLLTLRRGDERFSEDAVGRRSRFKALAEELLEPPQGNIPLSSQEGTKSKF